MRCRSQLYVPLDRRSRSRQHADRPSVPTSKPIAPSWFVQTDQTLLETALPSTPPRASASDRSAAERASRPPSAVRRPPSTVDPRFSGFAGSVRALPAGTARSRLRFCLRPGSTVLPVRSPASSSRLLPDARSAPPRRSLPPLPPLPPRRSLPPLPPLRPPPASSCRPRLLACCSRRLPLA